jgi:membrane protease YdiL (CAAX protease family)
MNDDPEQPQPPEPPELPQPRGLPEQPQPPAPPELPQPRGLPEQPSERAPQPSEMPLSTVGPPLPPEPPRQAAEMPPPASGTPPCAPQPERYPFWGYSDLLLFVGLVIPCLLLASAIVRVFFAVIGVRPGPTVARILPEQLLSYLLIFGALALILRFQYGRPFWSSMGWCRLRMPPLLIIGSGVICAFAVAWLGSLIQTPTRANPMTELLQGRVTLILMAIFGTTLAPIAEELGFRGFLQPLLVRSLGVIPGVLLAALPFGLLHYQEYGNSWRHAALIALAGASFGWMRQVTGSTKASSLMHAAYNGVIFAAVFAGGTGVQKGG